MLGGGLRQWKLILAVLALSALVLIGSPPVAARVIGCRADPIVLLSNGKIVRMTAQVDTAARNVRRITYTLHAPEGTSVRRIIYPGGALKSKERVVFIADLPANRYRSETLVDVRSGRVAVKGNTSLMR